jgi:hypothetical protein
VRKPRTYVGFAEFVGNELGELEHLGGELLRLGRESQITSFPGELRVLLVHHRDTAAGRRHDGVVTVLAEDADEPVDERQRFLAVPAVGVHLTAARLLHREDDLMTEPLENGDGRLTGLREERVVDTGDEKRDPHPFSRYTRVKGAQAPQLPAAGGTAPGTPSTRSARSSLRG